MSEFPSLDLQDIQGGVLHALPAPYVGAFRLLRIDDAAATRRLLAAVIPAIRNAENPTSADADAWISIAFTYQGLAALGVPQESLDSFAPEFRQGMAARAERLHDTGPSAPANWEPPFGTGDVHIAFTTMAPDEDRFQQLSQTLRSLLDLHGGLTEIYRLNCHSTDGTEPFGYRDNISHPTIAGSGIPPSNPAETPLAAGEFILGYEDESGRIPASPSPAALGRNGTYLVVRKLSQDVAAFRRYLREHTSDDADEALLAAKIMGRWRSGAPLVLAPEEDDPELGADPRRNNDFSFNANDDARGLATPPGSHIRRMNPRDATTVIGNVRRHRILRREAAYGSPLPDGTLEDDGEERGILFASVGAAIGRQFEFVQEEWVNSGIFIAHNDERDPLVGANDGTTNFTIPQRPIRRRLRDLPRFVTTRGGEYLFMPSFTALHWLSEMDAPNEEPAQTASDPSHQDR